MLERFERCELDRLYPKERIEAARDPPLDRMDLAAGYPPSVPASASRYNPTPRQYRTARSECVAGAQLRSTRRKQTQQSAGLDTRNHAASYL
eukprot:3605257-Rhodomonas_salina.4